MGLCVKHLWCQVFTSAKISACTTNIANLLLFTLSFNVIVHQNVQSPHHTISTLHSPIPVQVLKLKHIHSSGMLLTRNSTSEWSYQFSRSIPAHGGRYLKTYLRRYIRRYLQIPACRGRYLTCLLRQVFTNTHAYKWVFTNTHAYIRSRYLLNTSVCSSKYP